MEGIPGELENYFKKKFSKNAFKEEILIILDDLMDEALKSIKITQLFTRGRHDNLSLIYLTQNLFHKNQRALMQKIPTL